MHYVTAVLLILCDLGMLKVSCHWVLIMLILLSSSTEFSVQMRMLELKTRIQEHFSL
jgi:hypothetical protein